MQESDISVWDGDIEENAIAEIATLGFQNIYIGYQNSPIRKQITQ